MVTVSHLVATPLAIRRVAPGKKCVRRRGSFLLVSPTIIMSTQVDSTDPQASGTAAFEPTNATDMDLEFAWAFDWDKYSQSSQLHMTLEDANASGTLAGTRRKVSVTNLAVELWEHILMYLAPRDVYYCMLVSLSSQMH